MLRNICPIASILAAAWLIVPTAPADTPATQPAPESSQTESNEGKSRPEEGRQPEWLLHLDELSFDLGLESSYDRRVVSYDTRQFTRYRFHQTNRDFRLEETIGTRAAGALFDENVMLFDVGARWGMSQEWFRETRPGPDLRKSPHGDLLEYDLNFTLLPHGMVSANAYASRVDSRIPRAFQPSLDRTLERYGAGLFLNHRTFPMRLTFEHVWDDLDSRTDRLLDREERGRDTLAYEATWQISDRHSLRLDYQYDDRSERYSGGRTRFDTTRNYITLNHQLRFGLDGRSALETLARFQDETGDLARDIAEVSTQLRLQHTDSLSTNYRAQYLRESYQQLTTETWRGDIGLTHQLGDTLTSSLQLYGLRQSADENADFTEWGGVVSEYFSRDNKLGRFSANLSYNHAATDTEFGKRRGVVVYESLTFRDGVPGAPGRRPAESRGHRRGPNAGVPAGGRLYRGPNRALLGVATRANRTDCQRRNRRGELHLSRIRRL
jgi:hypothetical protein